MGATIVTIQKPCRKPRFGNRTHFCSRSAGTSTNLELRLARCARCSLQNLIHVLQHRILGLVSMAVGFHCSAIHIKPICFSHFG